MWVFLEVKGLLERESEGVLSLKIYTPGVLLNVGLVYEGGPYW